MKITGNLEEITVGIDEKGFVAALVEVAGALMPFVEVRRVGDGEVAHEILEVGPGCRHDYMEMVRHEYEGQETDPVDFQRAGEELQELSSVLIRKKDALPTVTPAGDVIVGILELNPERTAHRAKVPETRGDVKNKDLTPMLCSDQPPVPDLPRNYVRIIGEPVIGKLEIQGLKRPVLPFILITTGTTK